MKHSYDFCSAAEEYITAGMDSLAGFESCQYNGAEYVFIHHISWDLLCQERGSGIIEQTLHNAEYPSCSHIYFSLNCVTLNSLNS